MNIQSILRVKSELPVILAPMAGVTDLAFREICMQHGCDFTYSEMISAKAVSYESKKTFRLMAYSASAIPFGFQLFGHEPHIMGETAKRICDEFEGKLSLLDINMGCPAPKIVNNGDGSALMKDTLLASKVIEYVVKNSNVPVTVKIRSGFDCNHINAVEFAKMAESSGANAITVHGRTREQMYSGKSDMQVIAAVKNSVAIPVIGNGDISNAQMAQKMIATTGCDAIMVGRGAQGNPFIFDEIKALLCGKKNAPPSRKMRLECALLHAQLHDKYKSNESFPEMRKHIAWYTKGMVGSAALRAKIFSANSIDDVSEILDELLKLNI